jgi:phage N-6-adenine-methyltransferase
MSSENRYQKGNDECATPSWIKHGIFEGWYDPCPLSYGLVERDGLNSDWPSDKIFINPPYSKPMPWIERAIAESKKGKTIALLVKHDSSTQWWAKLHEAVGHFLPFLGRLSFNSGKPAPFPLVLVLLVPTKEADKK